jgi:hypothetical protein
VNRHLVALAVAALATACAGLPHPWPHDAVCVAPTGEPADAQGWLTLLLHGYDPATHRATSPAVDCSGSQVRWEAPALLCQDASTARAELPERPLAGEDVVVSPVDRDHRLVWIQTGRFASGDAFGPVALVEVGSRSVRVEALGTLRANPRRAKLQLEQAGGGLVLVAEGERCTSADPASCERSARLMALVGARFQPSRIVSPTGSCTAAGFVHLAREEVERLGGGRERRYRLDASLAPAKDGLRLTELVTVHDRDTRQAEAQERLVRRAEGTTLLRAQGADLVSDSATLWARMLSLRD